jgi:pimeloyl-ACP methyl ester carboxylesterase
MGASISPQTWQQRGKRMPFAAQTLFYRDSGGTKPALVLLHGFPTSSWDFAAIWDELAEHHRVIALDYLGFGFSDKPRHRACTVAGYADQVESMLRGLGVSRYHALAHDLGDTVAQELLARDRERASSAAGASPAVPRIESCFFLNGGLFPETHRPRLIQTLLASRLGFVVARLASRRAFGRSFKAVFGPHTKPTPAELDAYWTCIAHGAGQRLQHRQIAYMGERREQRGRWVAALTESRVPVAFCIGLADPVSGAHVVPRIRELMPDARITALSDIGHYPQVEASSQVLEAYGQFRRSAIP